MIKNRLIPMLVPVVSWLMPASARAQDVTQNIQQVTSEQIETARKLVGIVAEFFVKYSFQVLGGIIILVAGWLIAKYVANFISGLLERKKVDVVVAKFLVGAVKLLIMIFAVIVAMGKFGIEIAPLIAGISVVGFGTSFALQGPLSNYASGATLIFTKPFKVGDIIEVAGVTGEVIDMKLPRTELKTLDGEMIVIPNKHIIGEIIENYSGHKRLDIKVGVSYSADVDKAVHLIRDILKSDERIIKDKEPKIGIEEFGDSSINLLARLWCKQDDYWDVMFENHKKIFDAFNANGIVIPFPQRDVHMIKE